MIKRILEIAFGMILIGAVVGITFGIFNMGKRSTEVSQGTIGKTLNKYSDEYAQYDVGTLVLGEEVVGLISDDMEVAVKVITGVDTAGKDYINATGLADAKDSSKAQYINPYKNFKCTGVTRNKNGVITNLEFTQQ